MGDKREKGSFQLAKCPICGKKFMPAPHHRYRDHRQKYGGKYVCSWGCVCKSEAMRREREEAKRKARAEKKEKKI